MSTMRHTVRTRSGLLGCFAIVTALLLMWATVPVTAATATSAGTATRAAANGTATRQPAGTPTPTIGSTATPSPTATAVPATVAGATATASPTVAPAAATATITPTVPASPTATMLPPADRRGLTADITSGSPHVAAVLDGTDKVATYTVTITVADTRLLATGWRLALTSTTFSTAVAPTRRLSPAASTIAEVRAACAEGTSCTLPINKVAFAALALPAGDTAPAPVTFFSATPGTGTGTVTMTLTIAVRLPANAYAGTYTGTLAVTVVPGL